MHQLPGAGHVRALAQVEEPTVLVDRDHLVSVELLEALELERVVTEQLACLVFGDASTREGLIRRGDLCHLFLEFLEIFGRKGLVDLEVVVETVVDRRAEPDAGSRTQLAHGGGENVRRRVPQNHQGLRVLLGEDRDRGVGLDGLREADGLAVDHGRHRGLGETRADSRRHVTRRGATIHFEDVAIGKSDSDLFDGHGSVFGCGSELRISGATKKEKSAAPVGRGRALRLDSTQVNRRTPPQGR